MVKDDLLVHMTYIACECGYLQRQLAEECAELAHAALKLVRCSKGEIVNEGLKTQVKENYLEEIADVKTMLRLAECELTEDEKEKVYYIAEKKKERMRLRLSRLRYEREKCIGAENGNEDFYAKLFEELSEE